MVLRIEENRDRVDGTQARGVRSQAAAGAERADAGTENARLRPAAPDPTFEKLTLQAAARPTFRAPRDIG